MRRINPPYWVILFAQKSGPEGKTQNSFPLCKREIKRIDANNTYTKNIIRVEKTEEGCGKVLIELPNDIKAPQNSIKNPLVSGIYNMK